MDAIEVIQKHGASTQRLAMAIIDLTDEVEDLKAELSALKAVNAWHPASEKPTVERDYLVQLDTGAFEVDIFDSDEWLLGGCVTKWREIEPPEEER